MAHSPLLFEEDDNDEIVTVEAPLKSDELSNESSVVDLNTSQEKTEEDKLVEHLRAVLMGVPPPPAVTVSQYDASEILQYLNPENYENFQWNYTKGDLSMREENKSKAEIGDWPLVRDHFWFSVSFNRGPISEELALLIAKYQERYVGNETSSSVNSFFSKSPIRTASAKKRARRHAWGHSPGRRLSHLARRRHTFSSANLQQNACKSFPDKKKMILVNKRRSDVTKRNKNSASKSCSNLKIKLAYQSTVSSSKRALFQSPEDEKKSSMLNKRSVLSNKSKSSPCSKSVLRSKRALWPDAPILKPEIEKDKENGNSCNVNVNGKRTAELKFNSDLTVKKKCLRTLTFSDEQKTCDKVMPKLIPENLSQTHKQKLLWAVSDALRNKGIKTEHKHCKVYMLELFKICKDVWLKRCARQNCSGSTSERMSQLANRFCGEVVKKVKLKLEELGNIVNSRSSPNKNYQNCATEQSSFVDRTKDVKSSGNCDLPNVTKLVNSEENNVGVTRNGDSDQMLGTSCSEGFKSSDNLSSSSDMNSCNKTNLDLLITESRSKILARGSSGNKEKNDVSSTLTSDDLFRSGSRTLLNEKVFRYTLIDDKISHKYVTNSENGCVERYNTELYIDGFRNVPLHGVSLDCNNENSVSSNLVDEKEFSPCLSLIHDDDDTRGSSSCDVDLSKIIDMIDNSDHD